MLSQELPRHGKASSIKVGVSLHAGVSLWSWVLYKYHDCSHAAFSSMAWALCPSSSLPELMEILYTWIWPLPKDTPHGSVLCTWMQWREPREEGARSHPTGSRTW